MRFEKFRIPQIEDDATAFANTGRQSSENVAIRFGIEMSEALTHHGDCVEGASLGRIFADIGDLVLGTATKFARFCDRIDVTIDSGYRITAIQKSPRMPAHSPAPIQNFPEPRHR